MEASRQAFIQSELISQNEEFIRSTELGLKVLDAIKSIQLYLYKTFEENPSLEGIFNEEFENFDEFCQRENINALCLLDDYLFSEKELKPFIVDEEFSLDLVKSYVEEFQQWCDEKAQAHLKTQDFLKEDFDLQTSAKALDCRCYVCLGDFRTRIRDTIFKQCKTEVEEVLEDLEPYLEDLNIDKVNSMVYEKQKRIDNLIRNVRFKLRRSSINKLEHQIKAVLRENLSYHSPVGKKYCEALTTHFKKILQTQGLKRDLVGPQEYDRFFSQMGMGIWKTKKSLDREFNKVLKSVLTLKRKDISANILREYLGQFWLYSPARRLNRKIIYHMGPTNSGKTFYAIQKLCSAKNGCYLAPLRLLAGELYDTMNSKDVCCTLLTGEEVIEVEGATHFSSTIEMAKLKTHFECCVIDEIQMITDPHRGWAWTRAFVSIQADEVHICGDGSVQDLIEKIVALTGDSLEIRNYERLTPLKVLDEPVKMGGLKAGDALIVFSRRNALKYKADLEDFGFKVSIVYGRLSPEVRREQARKFDDQETDIIVSTDAISMGMNLPIKRIVFSTLSKHIDGKEYFVSKSEIKQIAGRAGRFKRHDVGYATCLSRVDDGIEKIKDAVSAELGQQEKVMIGPDLEIFNLVNSSLRQNALPELRLSEFLRLFNTMTFEKPFYCVDLKEMVELAEMVESANQDDTLSESEIFGFSCAPVNLGLVEHVQYYIYILNKYAKMQPIKNEVIDNKSSNIDYLETSIKCVELYQWLARHFGGKNFDFEERELLHNKGQAVDQLNNLLSERIISHCSSCGVRLDPKSSYNICEKCFKERRFKRRRPSFNKSKDGESGGRRGGKRSFHKKKGNGGQGKRRKSNSRRKGSGFNKK